MRKPVFGIFYQVRHTLGCTATEDGLRLDQLPRLGKRELICLLLFTCNYVVSVWRGFLFLWVLGMGYVILLWHSLSLPYNYFVNENFGREGVALLMKRNQSRWSAARLLHS